MKEEISTTKGGEIIGKNPLKRKLKIKKNLGKEIKNYKKEVKR